MFEGLPEHCGTLEECRHLATEFEAAKAAQEDTLHIVELKEKHAGLQRAMIADAKGVSLSMLTVPGVTHFLTKAERILHKYKLWNSLCLAVPAWP